MTDTRSGTGDGGRIVEEADRVHSVLDKNAHTKRSLAGKIVEDLRRLNQGTDCLRAKTVLWDIDRLYQVLSGQAHTMTGDVEALAHMVATEYSVQYYSTWQWGDPCPTCGSETFSVTETVTTEIRPGDTGEVQRGTVYEDETKSLTCVECWMEFPPHRTPDSPTR